MEQSVIGVKPKGNNGLALDQLMVIFKIMSLVASDMYNLYDILSYK